MHMAGGLNIDKTFHFPPGVHSKQTNLMGQKSLFQQWNSTILLLLSARITKEHHSFLALPLNILVFLGMFLNFSGPIFLL